MAEHEGIWTEYRPTYWDGWSACKRMGDLVRCRDCMRAFIGDARTDIGEPVLCHRTGWHVRPDGFCAWGVRVGA